MLKDNEISVIKKFYETKYPKNTHELGLDLCFDYYNAICLKLLKNHRNLKYQVETIPSEIKEKIEKYIKDNEKNDELSDMKKYYELLNSTIKVIKSLKENKYR